MSLGLLFCDIRFFIMPSWIAVVKHYRLRKNGVLAEAEIIDFECWRDSDGVDFKAPIIRYVSNDGAKVTAKLELGKPAREYPESQRNQFIYVYYDPADASQFVVKHPEEVILRFIMLFLGLAGLAVIVTGTCQQIF